jgi:nickel-dependent lactate racemase
MTRLKIEIGIGSRTHPLLLPDENVQALLFPEQIEHSQAGAEMVLCALRAPIGVPPLREVANPGERICIIVSDTTLAHREGCVFLNQLNRRKFPNGLTSLWCPRADRSKT